MSAGKPASPKKTSASQTRPLTTKQQRAAERERKLAEFRARQAREKRNRRIWIATGITAAVAAIAVLILSLVLAPQPSTPEADGAGGTGAIDGIELFDNGAGHVESRVAYPQTPPAGGEHHPYWLNCGVYEQPVPNENAVHSLEHGAVWVTYDATTIAGDDLSALRSALPSTYALLSPFDELPAPIVLSAWNAQLQVDSPDDARISQFLQQFWRSDLAPEPGAPCTGGVDAPGKVS